jgi:hypothetical protein
MRRSLVLVLAVACGGDAVAPASDCDTVLADPASAKPAITARYPGDPVKVASVIEDCVARGGSVCDRVVKLVAAAPAMAQLAIPKGADLATVCNGLPADMQQCLLPSYALAHAPTCDAIRGKIKQIALEPEAVVAPEQPANAPGCVRHVDVAIAAEGVWLSTERDHRCFAKRSANAIDAAWLHAELQGLPRGRCSLSVTVVGGPAASPADLAAAKAAVDHLGIDVALDPVPTPSYGAVPADPTGAPPHCDAR